MPKKPTFKESNNYIVLWYENGQLHGTEFIGGKNAVDGYRFLRGLHGDNCRLAKVVLNYGEEV